MGTTFENSTRTIWSLLIILTIIYRSMGSRKIIDCDYKENTLTKINSKDYFALYPKSLRIEYDTNVKVLSVPEMESLNIQFNNVTIVFEGQMYDVTMYTLHQIENPINLVWVTRGMILGLGKISKDERIVNDKRECRFFSELIDNEQSSVYLPLEVTEKIIYIAHMCIKNHICDKPVLHEYRINEMMDLAIERALYHLSTLDLGQIPLPDIDYLIPIRVLTTNVSCQLQASNGTFQNLGALKRKGDIWMTKVENVQRMEMDLELANALMTYNNYSISYGNIKANSHGMRTIVKKITINILITVDYANNNCSVHWERIKMKDFGKILVEFENLNMIEFLAPKISSWFQIKLREDIAKVLADTLTKTVNKHLNKHVCKTFKKFFKPDEQMKFDEFSKTDEQIKRLMT